MEENLIRRRNINRSLKPLSFTLAEELMILSSLRKKIYKFFDPLSVAIRACLLADLNLQNVIGIKDYSKGYIMVRNSKILNNELLDDVVYRIKLVNADAKKMVKLLNGESYKKSEFFLKKVRKRILRDLENKSVLKFENKFYYKIYVNDKVKDEIIDRLVEYINGHEIEIRNDMLLIALEYTGCLGIVFGGHSNTIFEKIKDRLLKLKRNLRGKCFIGEDYIIIYELMKFLLKD